MKINAMKKCCMETRQFLIFRSGGMCWLSNGMACWPTDGVELCEGNIEAIFDISPKQADKLCIQEREVEDERLALELAPHEEKMQFIGRVLDYGDLYVVLQGRDGDARLINAMWLKPAERRDEDLRFALRPSSNGEWVVAYCGLLAAAIITPVRAERAEIIMQHAREIAALQVARD